MNLKRVHKIRKYIHKHFNNTLGEACRALLETRMNGKGSKQRPTNKVAFNTNFDNIFRKKDKNQTKPEKKDERKVDK